MSIIVLNGGMRKNERRAIELSWDLLDKVPKENRYRHVSLIMSKDFLITWGVNYEGQNHDEATDYFHQSIHAEWLAVKRFKRSFSVKRLTECELYSIRWLRDRRVSIARPCDTCADFLRKHPLRKILYTGTDGRFHHFT